MDWIAPPAGVSPDLETHADLIMERSSVLRKIKNVQSPALLIVAVATLLFTLEWAQRFCIPLLLGIFVAYALNPLVVWLEQRHVPRPLGATLVLILVLSGIVALVGLVSSETLSVIDKLPTAATKLSSALVKSAEGPQPTALQKMREAARELQSAVDQATGGGPPVKGSAVAVLPPPPFSPRDFLLSNSMTAAVLIGNLVMVCFLVFFLLIEANTFKRQLMRLTGASLSKKKTTVRILDGINVSL